MGVEGVERATVGCDLDQLGQDDRGTEQGQSRDRNVQRMERPGDNGREARRYGRADEDAGFSRHSHEDGGRSAAARRRATRKLVS